jgi:hypothetical protein
MYTHESGLLLTGERHPGGAVCFIADDDVELGDANGLRLSDHIDRLVGREDDGDPVEVFGNLSELRDELGRVRRCWVSEVKEGDVFVGLALADTHI